MDAAHSFETQGPGSFHIFPEPLHVGHIRIDRIDGLNAGCLTGIDQPGPGIKRLFARFGATYTQVGGVILQPDGHGCNLPG